MQSNLGNLGFESDWHPRESRSKLSARSLMLAIKGSWIGRMEDEEGASEVFEMSLASQLEALHPRSFGWAVACCAWEHEEAADVLQASYLKVLEGRAIFGGRSEFSTWFFGVVRVTASEWRSKRLRRRLLMLKNQTALAPSKSYDKESVDEVRLRSALHDLPRRQREVLHLVFYSELSIREASEVMNVGLGTARVHYERGKSRLRQRLRKEEE